MVNQTGIRLKPFEASDTEMLIEVFRNSVHKVNLGDYSQQQVEAWAPTYIDVASWQQRFLENYTVVALIDDKVIGFSELSPDEWIHTLFVTVDAQRKGVASTLLGDIETEAIPRSISPCVLKTHASITAKRFFEHHKYQCIEQRNVEVRGQNLTNFLMQKTLD